ncbi:MAG TPA: hypothetical protein VFE32_18525 [Puia sp.]|jgi:hypothetical protein|nr:hypothetical protein [Puia sp.]
MGELYQIRWCTEEGYKMYKARVQVEAFSGKTAAAIKQDIYAKVMMTLCAALVFPMEERVIAECNADKKNGKVKYRRKIDRTFAYWSTIAPAGITSGSDDRKTVPYELQRRPYVKILVFSP